MRGWRAYTLLFGAAYSNASPAQREQMADKILPKNGELRQRDLSRTQVEWIVRSSINDLRDIMGKDWQPNEEWMSAINSMLGE